MTHLFKRKSRFFKRDSFLRDTSLLLNHNPISLMKKLLFLCAVCFFTVQLSAQSVPAHQKFTTPVHFEWAPDGSGLYLTVIKVDTERGGPPQSSIFFASSDGQLNPVIKDGSAVTVSPDGKQLAFVRAISTDRFAGNALYLFDLETKTEKLLLADGNRKGEINFSPDGKRIAYTVIARDLTNPRIATGDIYVCDLASKKVEQLTRNEYGKLSHSPQWDATGDKILYYQEVGDNHDQIYVTDAKGKSHINLTADANTHNFYPVWYGKKIMYIQSNKVMTMDADGKNRTEMTGLTNPFLAKANVAQNKLAYLSRTSMEVRGANSLVIVDLKTNEAKAIVDNEAMAKLEL
jgi:Tol biopolymer transport system component